MQRSLKMLRERGWTCEIVEQNIHAGERFFKRDLFGFADIICVSSSGTLAVQTTTYSNMSSRLAKAAANEHVKVMKAAGWKLVVHGWRKLKSGWWACEERSL